MKSLIVDDDLDPAKIIMTTALDYAHDMLQATENGCDSFIVKPIDRQKITEGIENLGFVLTQIE